MDESKLLEQLQKCEASPSERVIGEWIMRHSQTTDMHIAELRAHIASFESRHNRALDRIDELQGRLDLQAEAIDELRSKGGG